MATHFMLFATPEDVGQRGAFVGFGNTEPGTSADVFGLEQRGAVGDGDFRPSDGGGYVAYKKADYAHALSRSVSPTYRCTYSKPSAGGATRSSGCSTR